LTGEYSTHLSAVHKFGPARLGRVIAAPGDKGETAAGWSNGGASGAPCQRTHLGAPGAREGDFNLPPARIR
jgi:hypothetical protein